VHARGLELDEYKKYSGRQAGSPASSAVATAHSTAQEMDAMDEFQEADILWPDTEDEFAPMDMEELYEAAGSASSVAFAPVFGRRFEGFFLSGAGPGASPDADDEEWQEADVLWPDTADELRGSGGGLMWPFSGSSGGGRAGRRVKPAAARRDGWTTGPAASSPINIPANVALRRS